MTSNKKKPFTTAEHEPVPLGENKNITVTREGGKEGELKGDKKSRNSLRKVEGRRETNNH